ncbi:MAG: hypothetical protein L3J63_05790 [Geopsychrobacter sp.]|nr:hypothetical protein [Geopsychrobacter sp.]
MAKKPIPSTFLFPDHQVKKPALLAQGWLFTLSSNALLFSGPQQEPRTHNHKKDILHEYSLCSFWLHNQQEKVQIRTKPPEKSSFSSNSPFRETREKNPTWAVPSIKTKIKYRSIHEEYIIFLLKSHSKLKIVCYRQKKFVPHSIPQ